MCVEGSPARLQLNVPPSHQERNLGLLLQAIDLLLVVQETLARFCSQLGFSSA